MKRIIFLMFLTGIFFVSCRHLDDAPVPVIPNCDKNAVVDEMDLDQISTVYYGITAVVLNGPCLEVTIGATGCNPNNWDMNLFVVPSIATVYLPLFNAKVVLINNELCMAVFQTTVSFDLTALQRSGTNRIQLDIVVLNTPIIYQY